MTPDQKASVNSKACAIKLRRIGDADGQIVEILSQTTIPSIGEVIEVSVDGAVRRARVFQTHDWDANGVATIEADELSSSYVWDTFSALAEFDAGEGQPDPAAAPSVLQPHKALVPTLGIVRQCHVLARCFLDRPKPDLTTALRYMRAARRAAWLAFPYVKDAELRRRITSHEPMSQAEWDKIWPSIDGK